jgi:Na+-transporting methylmalonyl-CoA/oxaloacetate decarboxylase gamma subunit
MVLVFLLILIIAILLAFFNRHAEPEKEKPEKAVSELRMDKENTNEEVYRL